MYPKINLWLYIQKTLKSITYHSTIRYTSISKTIKDNAKTIVNKYPDHRWFENLGVNAHLSITPPLPYKFYIHQEGLEKIWSSVTYITPEKNVGTKMYTAQEEEDTFRHRSGVETQQHFHILRTARQDLAQLRK